MTESNQKRVGIITKEIAVRPAVIYQAILNPEALVMWLPPYWHEWSTRPF